MYNLCNVLKMSMSINLSEFVELHVIVTSKMMESAGKVTGANALEAPKFSLPQVEDTCYCQYCGT